MNIKQAKQEITNTLKAYLTRDEWGDYLIPTVRQRPILLMGPPGIGKTQIMEQIAAGDGGGPGGLHHHPPHPAERHRPALHRENGPTAAETYSVTEYTMSEIVASVYEQDGADGSQRGHFVPR